MKSMLLACGLVAAFAATGAAAGPAKQRAMSTPSQPVPYTMLDAYLKASPAKRQAMLANASSATVQSDAAATTSPTTPGATAATPETTPGSSTSGATTTDDSTAGSTSSSGSVAMPPGPVNPTTSTTPTDSDATKPSTGSATSPSTSEATSPTKK